MWYFPDPYSHDLDTLRRQGGDLKRLIFIFSLYGLLVSCAYGDTINFKKGTYVGEVARGLPHGYGTYTGRNGYKYVGQYKSGLEHGYGTATFNNGTKYVGELKDDLQHGQGTYTWPDGSVYAGEWKRGNMHGQGAYTSAKGDKYVGAFRDDKRHGHGAQTWADAEMYVGQWKYGYEWTGTTFNASGDVTAKLLDGLPKPYCDGASGRIQGTGFAVNEWHVVTAAHALYCCKEITIRHVDNGLCADEIRATVLATAQRSDLGLLKLEQPINRYATLRAGAPLRLGAAVSTYDFLPGNGGCNYVVRTGKVTQLDWLPDDSRLMVHDSPTSPGSSGGPVLDQAGHVVGVSQSDFEYGSAVNIAGKSRLLEEFLTTNSIHYRKAPSTKKLSLSNIKLASEKFTVLVKCLQ